MINSKFSKKFGSLKIVLIFHLPTKSEALLYNFGVTWTVLFCFGAEIGWLGFVLLPAKN